ITFLSLRQFSENITATVLPKTPLTVITLAFLGVACYGVILGLEGIARVVWVITPFSLVALVTLLGGGYLTHHGDNPLFPFWGWGAGATVGWGLLRSADFAELLLLGLLVPHFRRLDLLRKTAWIALGSSVLIIAGTVVLYEQIFPWPGGGRISFPLLEVSRLIITGRWVQRLESIFFLVWVIMATLAVTTGLYATVRTLAETIGLENERHLVLPVALTLYSLAQLPSNLALAVAWDAEGVRTWGWSISIVLPLLTLLVSTLRRKGANRAS
ncbi:MAG TPA: GerAB/ArcD/ProY family transporter, partial [Symbiobacteriaceae bacterium]|nr:GerAB/ArcD/ProY family transporter [Symbiobacteriaceae bacterium]